MPFTTATAFKEFKTDDLEVLSAEVVTLDKVYGHENIKVVKEIDVIYDVQIVDNEATDDETNNENTGDTTEPSEPDNTNGDDGDGDDTDVTP